MNKEENELQLSAELIEQLKLFFEHNDSLRISRNLRKVFFEYLKFQQGNLDNSFDEIICDVEAIINFLEALEQA